jgi:hypothetical protein
VNANGSIEGPNQLDVTVVSVVTNGSTAVFVATCVMTDSKIFGGSTVNGVTAGKGFMSRRDTIRGGEKGTGPKGDGRDLAVKGIGANNGTPTRSDMMGASVDV